MEIQPTISLLNRVTLQPASSADIQNWRVGQLLQATVQAKPDNGLTQLLINNRIYNAQIQASVDIGQKLILEVVKLGTLPELRTVPADPVQSVLNNALRNNLPVQKPHSDLIANVMSLLAQTRNAPAVPAAVVQVIKTLVGGFPDVQQISTQDGLRQAIRNSGIFLESALNPKSSNTPALALDADFKANLMRLQRALVQANANQVSAEPQASARAPLTNTRPGADSVNMPVTAQNTQVNPTVDNPRSAVRESGGYNPANLATTSASNLVSNPASNLAPKPSLNQSAGSPPGTPTSSQGTVPPGASSTAATNAGEGARSNITQSTPVERAVAPTTLGTAVHQAASAMNSSPVSTNPAALMYEKPENIWMPGAFIPFRLHQPHAQPRSASNLFQQDSIAKILAMLLKDTDSSIARVHMNQILSRTVEQDTKQVWLFEIPVRKDQETDIFHFRIEKDSGQQAQDNEDQAPKWSIQLAFELPGLGPVHARVSMARENVSILFWAEVADTVEFFRQHLQELENNLALAGLSVHKISCMQGKPPDQDMDDMEKRKLLDEQV